MAIRESLLAILEDGPAHGYQLKGAFETRTGQAWPLNIGQVYQTLSRLERDELVTSGGGSDEVRRTYRITDRGRTVVREWFQSPQPGPAIRRDELPIKLLMALGTNSTNPRSLIQEQRTATVATLQEYTRLKAHASPDADLPWLMVLDSLILRAEADVRWLDMCEARLAHGRPLSQSGTGRVPDPVSEEARR